MPADTRYSIADLARLAGVTSRTIRYYVTQGLLASPDTLGPKARYTDGHLARLRLIRRLQREHLPLAEIRSRLAGMTDADVGALLSLSGGTGDAGAEPPQDSAVDYVRRLLRPAAPVPVTSASIAPPAPPPPSFTAPGTPVPAPPAPLPDDPSAFGVEASPAEPDRSTWERLGITRDIEIHIRRPLDRRANKQVDRLVRIARELLGDES